MTKTKVIVVLLVVLAGFSCQKSEKLFDELPSSHTGIDFKNAIQESNTLNVLTYEYFYNGGGVAVGDINNDGLLDLYFTANMGQDALYLNKGGLVFEEITEKAGITWNGEWKTGVTFVDINQDDLLDIYVSCSGNIQNPALRQNKLYINNGDLTFVESASQYGLNSDGFTTHSTFFDYDKDGDLDAYVMNHNVEDFKRFDVAAIHQKRDPYAGDQLLENRDGVFVDVTEQAGIKNNPIGFGLGLHVADLNEDGWPDIYISNDYIEADYLYLNQQDGTFTDAINSTLDHSSYFSMGNDIGDVNNDLLPDIFTSDMLPEDNKRQKLLFGPEKYEAYLSMLRNGFLPEVMRNMLHLNNGDGTFSEIGQVAGVSNTDWSWSPLLADFNNDGFTDLFVSNGYLRDYTNHDFIKFYAEERSEGRDNVMDIIEQMPSTLLTNYIFENVNGFQFADRREDWGLNEKRITNGAIYADLDNDGDLEIITNNLNEKASILENKLIGKNYLKIALKGKEAFNAKVKLYAGNLTLLREYSLAHGFQSGMNGPLHFGLGDITNIDSLVVEWNNGMSQRFFPSVNTLQEISFEAGESAIVSRSSFSSFFTQLESNIIHEQREINDFSRNILLPYMYSYQGPCLAVGDVNNDGLDDFYLGGGKQAPGRIFLGKKDGFALIHQEVFKQDELSTDSDAAFSDVDGDGDLDLLVTSSGFEYLPNDLLLQNRLYLNDGNGKFTKSQDALPPDLLADNAITFADIDGDGDEDVFVGGFVVPQQYPRSNLSRFYRNENGKFKPWKTFDLGIVSDAVTFDFDKDGDKDLLISTEWGPIYVLENKDKELLQPKAISPAGLWQSLSLVETSPNSYNIIAGNFGENSQLKASLDQPMQLYLGDFDGNSRLDPLLSVYIQNKAYPFFSRDEMSSQMPLINKLYPSYEAYSQATTAQLLADLKVLPLDTLKVETLRTQEFYFTNGEWKRVALPVQFQFAPVYGTLSYDFDADGDKDLVVGGNNYRTRVRLGNLDANHGQFYLKENNEWKYQNNAQSGLNFLGDVRSIKKINEFVVVAANGGALQIYKMN